MPTFDCDLVRANMFKKNFNKKNQFREVKHNHRSQLMEKLQMKLKYTIKFVCLKHMFIFFFLYSSVLFFSITNELGQ